MAKITIEELSSSLKEYLNGLGLTEEQVQELIDKMVEENIGDISQLSTEEKGSLVGAINELFINANNGKQLIADAIGEPLDSSDTFSAMSNNINGLLSTFKINMMNNGVTVESSDKFKALIDKIATLADSEGKGVQFAQGTVDNINLLGDSNTGWVEHKVNIEVPFTPNRIILYVEKMLTSSSSGYYIKSFNVDSEYCFSVDSCFTLLMYGATYLYITDITNEGFSVYTKSNITTGTSNEFVFQNITWYAIGVGEDDTTLRDSLASILTEEGVSVTEEDDMSGLITKVDEEFEEKNNEINNLNEQVNSLQSSSVKYATSGFDYNGLSVYTEPGESNSLIVNMNLDFTPTKLLVHTSWHEINAIQTQGRTDFTIDAMRDNSVTIYEELNYTGTQLTITIENITSESFTIKVSSGIECSGSSGIGEIYWEAFKF